MEKLGDYQLDKSSVRSQWRNGFEFEQSDVIQFFIYMYRVSIYHHFDKFILRTSKQILGLGGLDQSHLDPLLRSTRLTPW
jgi:hypothetical protein